MSRRWTIGHDDRPVPANRYRTQYWTDRAKYDSQWRITFGWLARRARIPKLDAAIVTVYQVCRRGTTLPDVGACFETAKAAIDGIVDVGVLVDDNPAHLLALNFVAPQHGDKDQLILVIEEYEEAASS